MAAGKYPLDPLMRVRRRRADEALRDLSSAVGAREVAETRLGSVERDLARCADAAAQARHAEVDALSRGQLRAADLQQQGAWELRVRREQEDRTKAVDAAREAAAAARGRQGQAQEAAARAEAGARVVADHRTRWVAAERRNAEAAAEADAAEAWRPRP